MKRLRSFVFACILVISAVACKKGSDDTQSPVITLTSPANHQVFAAGQTVTISAMITDNGQIQQVHLWVNDKSDNAEILHFQDDIESNSYQLTKTFTPKAGVTYTIEVEAIDRSQNDTKLYIEVSGS